ncbi:exodeoxyribonuclease VII small subunit [Actinospongicola halichondriae]|uniref:exodeoxyribonuclease VII small subunit n=1 Tax=Actinospongicola halichondriae TaxID=3236844 RepID=UPI003D496702
MTHALDPVPTGYAEAIEELESILREIEDDDVDVDLLAERVSRAAGLIEFCRDRIVAARAAVDDATATPDDADDD